MTKADIIELQRQLKRHGFEDLVVDGIYGPVTARAYERYMAARLDSSVPPIAPPPSKPWWRSRAIWGALMAVAAGGASLAGYEFDAAEATDVVLQIVTVLAALVSFLGSVRRSAPIDPSRVVPGVRVSHGRLHRDRPLPPDTDRDSRGYWSGDRGPFNHGG